ncbi:MAG: vitamin K epoxide reductase family protein [Acidimicrobiales bacterium]
MSQARTGRPAALRPDSALAPWLPWAAAALSAAGLAVAAYLTAAHYTSPKLLVCSGHGLVDCAKVTTSPQSEVFGVLPVAVIGLVYFAVMLVLSLPAAWRPSKAVLVVRQALVTAGIGFVLYLVATELLVLSSICIWCTATHVLELALFLLVTAGTSSQWPPATPRR